MNLIVDQVQARKVFLSFSLTIHFNFHCIEWMTLIPHCVKKLPLVGINPFYDPFASSADLEISDLHGENLSDSVDAIHFLEEGWSHDAPSGEVRLYCLEEIHAAIKNLRAENRGTQGEVQGRPAIRTQSLIRYNSSSHSMIQSPQQRLEYSVSTSFSESYFILCPLWLLSAGISQSHQLRTIQLDLSLVG